MPSTEYFGYELSNLGPLTTTFSAPASCASNTASLVVVDNSFDPPMMLRSECGTVSIGEDCIPSADALNDHYSTVLEDDQGHGMVPYHSPGYVCPSGWTTAGAASYESNTLSATGVFSGNLSPHEDESRIIAAGMPIIEVFLSVLGDDETVVWCCPRYVASPPTDRTHTSLLALR